jgi:trehalose 6-phosphate synthase
MRIVTCSNSTPRWDKGVLLPRSPGGLVPMVIELLAKHGGHWIFTAPPDVEAAEVVPLDGDIWLHPMELDEELRRQHYDTVSIELFLGLLHYMYDTPMRPVFDGSLVDAWAGYEAVNRAYAKRLAEVVTDAPDELVLVNDPHLMLVPEFFAAQSDQRRNRLAYFLGTPWVEPDYFAILPMWMRSRILESLLQSDIVGFHADRWVQAFLACCARFVPDARIEGREVTYRGHVTKLVAVPFPLDVDTLDEMRDEPATLRWEARLGELAQGRRVMSRADRVDLWKNIPRGFAAYELLLERRPELAEECWFAAVVTVPSRPTERHRAYQEATEAAVRRINERFGSPGREAASLIYPGTAGDSRNCVVAALKMSRAAIVNSTYDGLNLFAKEAAYLMDDGASLLISENAGVYEQFRDVATALHPFDLEQTSQAMEAALTGEDRHASPAATRRELLRGESVTRWLEQVFGL